MKRLLLTPLLLALTSCGYASFSEANEIKKRCLTVHGIHSAKALGLANSDWKVPKDHLCSPVKK